MPDIDYQLRDIKGRIEEAQARRAGAEHEQRVAMVTAENALTQIKAEFGCADIEQAKVLLQQLEAAASAECLKVEDQLAVAEGI
jgi:hypothetical protein